VSVRRLLATAQVQCQYAMLANAMQEWSGEVDALKAALHATDLDRLHLLERTARARHTITTLALALGVLWPEDGVADAVADSLADLARALADQMDPDTRDALMRRADARADDVAVAVLIADRDARTPTEGTPDA
jgi:hypothetical protein